jgi:hypothetical protein
VSRPLVPHGRNRATAQRTEQYFGPWLPEENSSPIAKDDKLISQGSHAAKESFANSDPTRHAKRRQPRTTVYHLKPLMRNSPQFT